ASPDGFLRQKCALIADPFRHVPRVCRQRSSPERFFIAANISLKWNRTLLSSATNQPSFSGATVTMHSEKPSENGLNGSFPITVPASCKARNTLCRKKRRIKFAESWSPFTINVLSDNRLRDQSLEIGEVTKLRTHHRPLIPRS